MKSDELERIYDAHANALFAFLLHWTRNRTETQEILQEIFCRLATQPALLNGIQDERGYLIRLANNLAIDHIRRRVARDRIQDRWAEDMDSPLAPASTPDEAVFRDELSAALRAIPDEQRAVVHLKLWEGWTFERIAEALEIPLNTAASRYRYGLEKLRTRLSSLYREIQ